MLNEALKITQNRLSHPENYGIYSAVAKGNDIYINTNILTRESWISHYTCLLNLFKDGIETDEVHNSFVHVTFADGEKLDLSLPDYMLNLIMWNMLIRTDIPICSYHVFFTDEIKKDTIKDYIDKFLIDTSRKRFSNIELNNIIDDTLYRIHDLDSFAFYFSNTVNLEDNVFLMQKDHRFYDCMHVDISGVQLEDVKDYGMKYANESIDIIKHSRDILGYDHCLADACRASEGINPKQYKEFAINIGTKPNNKGSVHSEGINSSFMNGGVASPVDYFIESSTGRAAQIIKFNNVGSSGYFARLLGLNNMDSKLNEDPNYDCHSRNFIPIVIKDKKTLKMLNNRYYRDSPMGMEKLIKKSDSWLIGRTVYLRSPITCASAARGKGVCYKCYGDLAYTVFDSNVHFGLNIGRNASETLSSSLTQKLLSAKHLLETHIEKLNWCDKFAELFEIEGNIIALIDEVDYKDFKLVIDPESIESENDEDDDLSFSDDDSSSGSRPMFNEYITEFDVIDPDGIMHHISNDKGAKLYISNELGSIIKRKNKHIDEIYNVDFSDIKGIPLFIVNIQNNELSKTLEHLEHLLNNNGTMKGLDLPMLLQELIKTVIDGGLNIASVHLELIVSNQVRDPNNILERVKWWMDNPPYEILSLNKALTFNPNITISLSYQKVAKTLYSPISFKKKAASFMDLFFMERPQFAIRGEEEPKDPPYRKPEPGELIEPFTFFEDPNKITVAPSEIVDDDSSEDE